MSNSPLGSGLQGAGPPLCVARDRSSLGGGVRGASACVYVLRWGCLGRCEADASREVARVCQCSCLPGAAKRTVGAFQADPKLPRQEASHLGTTSSFARTPHVCLPLTAAKGLCLPHTASLILQQRKRGPSSTPSLRPSPLDKSHPLHSKARPHFLLQAAFADCSQHLCLFLFLFLSSQSTNGQG